MIKITKFFFTTKKIFLSSSDKVFQNFKDKIFPHLYKDDFLLKNFISNKPQLSEISEITEVDIEIYNKLKYKYYDLLTSKRQSSLKEKYFFDYFYYFVKPFGKLIESYKKPHLVGIQAPQGYGKTTICEILQFYLELKGLKIASFSSDDYYKTHVELVELKKYNPNYLFRGPPGTHSIELIYDTLNNFKNGKKNYHIQTFNKKLFNGEGDRSNPIEVKEKLDVIIFEGWFNGIKPVSKTQLEKNLKTSDKNYKQYEEILTFQLEVNEKLKDYLKIWDLFDEFLLVKPEDYEFSKKWRIETEKVNGGMDEQSIDYFIDYFWKSVPPQVYFNNMLDNNYSIKTNGCLNPLKLHCDFERNFYLYKN